MFKVFANAWKIPDLRKKLLYTLMLIVIFRLGSSIPVPFVSAAALKEMLSGGDTLFSMYNIISGGAFENATIFAMSITPYINSSIIMQLLSVAIPALERKVKEGEEGRKFIAQWTRYLTVVLALLQATGLYFGLQGAITTKSVFSYLVVVFTFTAGTAFLMWLGEQINEKGIGNGISLIIFSGIVSSGPALINSLIGLNQAGKLNIFTTVLIVLFAILVVGIVVLMNNAERRIPVQYAKRVVGRKMYGGQSTHIPIKVAMAGVMPIIFAVSIISFPATICQLLGVTAQSSGFWGGFLRIMSQGSLVYGIIYFLLIIFFTYFYTEMQYNPIEMANNMKQNGGFVPGIRPGRPTSDFIKSILTKITLVGAIFLALIAVLPMFLTSVIGAGVAFGGTSILIVVGVALETVKQLESQMLMRHYKGFLE
ncbi:MAG: preprotein translocase subunit SecY [Ruminococcaceae bacterium]|nr:preprotein translocase subunit SecY [Oscillospiraceae bacterium]